MLGVAVLVTYVVSLTLNPWVKCSKCHGKPKKQGSLFSYAHHICDKCGGSGQYAGRALAMVSGQDYCIRAYVNLDTLPASGTCQIFEFFKGVAIRSSAILDAR